MSGTASGTSNLLVQSPTAIVTQTTTAQQSTDWYGTVRGRLGWLATPNLLLFGTGGFAYGRVSDSANVAFSTSVSIVSPITGFAFSCAAGPCYLGSSSAIRTGWTAGGGLEWLLDQHWSAKIEYQFVDLGTETVLLTALCSGTNCGGKISSFNAVFHDRFNVVRLGLNYRF